MQPLKPVEVTANRKLKQLFIVWSDGHQSAYPFALVRYACPCAECRGGHAQMSALPDEHVFDYPLEDSPATRIKNIEPVGSYALTLEWEDGHHYGIYNWQYLRALCPCNKCRPQEFVGKQDQE